MRSQGPVVSIHFVFAPARVHQVLDRRQYVACSYVQIPIDRKRRFVILAIAWFRMQFDSAFDSGLKMASFRVPGRLNCGTVPASDTLAMDAACQSQRPLQ